MLNSNFDLRTFLTESKNPTLSEGAKFKVGDMVKLSGGEPTEVLAVRKMTDSDLHAYSIKNSKGERAEYDETQLTAADVSEVLSEATVMEYIREKMDHMNNEVRSCMKEYLQRCNEIDPGHEDAHAQLMGALEDFYNKLKAHFEADEAGEEHPEVTGDIPPMPLGEGEEEAFGGEEDELEEVKVKVDIPGQDSFEAEEGKEYSEEEADKYIKNAKDSEATPMNTKFSKVNEEDGVTYPEDKHTLTPDELGHEVEEEVNEAIDPETVDLLMGLAKSAVTMGTVPAALAVLYQFKDHPKIAKVVTAFEKHLDK